MTSAYEIPSWKTEMKELAPNVYGYFQAKGSWFVGNTGLIVGKEYAVVVDSLATFGMNQDFIKEIRKITDKPIRFLINTHHHGDHIWGNHFFPGAAILCQTRCREESIKTGIADPKVLAAAFPGIDFQGIRLTPANVTFEKKMTLYMDEREIQLIYCQPAHTVGDILVNLPQDKILFCGDLLFYYSTPLCLQGSFSGWMETLKTMSDLDPRIYVPGHGPACDQSGLRECLEYLRLVSDEGRKLFESGMDAFDAAQKIHLGNFRKWANWERIAGNLDRLFREFRGEQPDSAVDIPVLRGWMNKLAASGDEVPDLIFLRA